MWVFFLLQRRSGGRGIKWEMFKDMSRATWFGGGSEGDGPRDDLKLGDPVLPLMLCDHLGLRILPEGWGVAPELWGLLLG